ncbi:MAG TPA: hypothetical protein VGS58_03320 [Candidatus Sulfopaludibacter sp.]|nr:hypothetical protein [Candidatus Sulfopaludibacter sp.]
MVRGLAFLGVVLVLGSAPLLADFSYQQKSTITGGMMASVMKVAGVFSKQAREPQQATVAVKGDRMVHRYATHMQVIDLGAQTITSVDLQKKTYTTMTFEQFKQMLAQMQDAMQKSKDKENAPDIKFKVSAKNTGATKTIGGAEAKESVITMEMQGTDQQTGQTGGMVVTTDVWIAPAANGYQEIRDFYKRMAEKLDWAPGTTSFPGHPEMAKGMAESMKEVGKLDGMPVYEITSMGMTGQPSSQSNAGAQQSQQQSSQPSVGGAIGSALGSRFGLGRKKKDQQQSPADSQSPGAAPPAGANGAPNGLMEMTIEMSGFSSASVDDSQFAIPAGFKQVEADMRRGMQ